MTSRGRGRRRRPPARGPRRGRRVLWALLVADVLLAAGLVRAAGSWRPVVLAVAVVLVGLLLSGRSRAYPRRR